MYSVLLSRIECSFDLVVEFIKKDINKNTKVLILPWAFPVELDSKKLMNDFFKVGGKRYNRYINEIKKLGINEKDIFIGNCYSNSKKKIVDLLNKCDILVLPGGNPEMMFSKIVHDMELLYEIKHYKGMVIGESAGCELQLKRYFITAKNNYYKYFAFYDGFGILNDPFYIDVHSINNKFYLDKLQKVACDTKRDVYAIFDDGAIIYDRKTKKINIFGNVKKFKMK